jgi:hypothetical protein
MTAVRVSRDVECHGAKASETLRRDLVPEVGLEL